MKLPILCGLLGVAALLAGPAAACDRSQSPLEPPAVAAAVADVVAIAEATAAADGVAAVKLVGVLKGAVRAGDSLSVRANTGPELQRCGGLAVQRGKRYLMMLWGPAGEGAGARKEYQPVDEYGGILSYSPEAEKALRDALASPHPHSPFGPIAHGIAAQLVPSPRPPTARGDVDLVVVFRNTTARPLELVYDSWPRATQSACTLDLVSTTTHQPVAARDVPIPKPDIEQYFSKHARRYKIQLPPGAAYPLLLQRVTTASPGWGYKEELGFLYYPIVTPGPHTLAVTCRNLFGQGSQVRTGTLTLSL